VTLSPNSALVNDVSAALRACFFNAPHRERQADPP